LFLKAFNLFSTYHIVTTDTTTFSDLYGNEVDAKPYQMNDMYRKSSATYPGVMPKQVNIGKPH
jgi:hypothetical protein